MTKQRSPSSDHILRDDEIDDDLNLMSSGDEEELARQKIRAKSTAAIKKIDKQREQVNGAAAKVSLCSSFPEIL